MSRAAGVAGARDIALLAVATHKLSRLLCKDKVTSVLAVCPDCAGQWVASVFGVLGAADVMNMARTAGQKATASD